jgi:hypothetical protein
MKTLQFFITTFVVFLLAASTTAAQTKSPVEGVWKLIGWIEHGDTNTNPQPGLIILTKGYYSVALLTSSRPGVEPPKERGKLTDAEKIARFEQWKSFVGVSGTYEVKGSILVMRPIVAMALWAMNRKTPEESTFKFEDPNTIWVLPTAPSATSGGLQMKFTRVE